MDTPLPQAQLLSSTGGRGVWCARDPLPKFSAFPGGEIITSQVPVSLSQSREPGSCIHDWELWRAYALTWAHAHTYKHTHTHKQVMEIRELKKQPDVCGSAGCAGRREKATQRTQRRRARLVFLPQAQGAEGSVLGPGHHTKSPLWGQQVSASIQREAQGAHTWLKSGQAEALQLAFYCV